MARYRLRFLLQEFDLPRGSTVVGRSLDCNLTIEDPLVSRQHASIVVDDEGGTVEDMGSRNGVRVNGAQIHEATRLRDGDRVRIGTQDFVFCRVDPAGKSHTKTTGVLRLCAKCRLPYPREMVACPSCEATEQTDEDTLSGSFGTENQTAWSVQLLVESLERALTLGRLGDAERIARRAISQVEDLVVAGVEVDHKTFDTLAGQAVSTTLATNDPTWLLWVLDVYRRSNRVPPIEIVERVGEAAAKHRRVASTALAALLGQLDGRPHGGSSSDLDSIARLAKMRTVLEDGDGGPRPDGGSDATDEWPGPS